MAATDAPCSALRSSRVIAARKLAPGPSGKAASSPRGRRPSARLRSGAAGAGARLVEIFVTSEAAERHADIVAAAEQAGVPVLTRHRRGDRGDLRHRHPAGHRGALPVPRRRRSRRSCGAAPAAGRGARARARPRQRRHGASAPPTRPAPTRWSLTDGSVDVYNPKAVRASVGSLFHLPVAVGVPAEQAVGRRCAPRACGCWPPTAPASATWTRADEPAPSARRPPGSSATRPGACPQELARLADQVGAGARSTAAPRASTSPRPPPCASMPRLAPSVRLQGVALRVRSARV